MSTRTVIHIGMPIMILVSVAFHFIVAGCIVYRQANADLVVLSGLDGVSTTFGFEPLHLAAFLFTLGVLAIAGVLLESRLSVRICTALVLPQYAVMLWALADDILLVIGGENPATHVSINRSILLTVCAAVIVIAVGHTVAFIERYIVRWLR